MKRPLPFCKTKPINNMLRLHLSHRIIIERCIVTDCIRIHDEPVIGNHRSPRIFRLTQNRRECIAIHRSNDDDFAAPINHMIDLRNLFFRIIIRKLYINIQILPTKPFL